MPTRKLPIPEEEYIQKENKSFARGKFCVFSGVRLTTASYLGAGRGTDPGHANELFFFNFISSKKRFSITFFFRIGRAE